MEVLGKMKAEKGKRMVCPTPDMSVGTEALLRHLSNQHGPTQSSQLLKHLQVKTVFARVNTKDTGQL